jgi:hypothetical protein
MNIFNDDSNFLYLLNAMGQKVKINDNAVQAIVSNIKDKIIDYKKIKTIIQFNTGDTIEYQGINWVVISEVSKTNTIYKATIRKSHHVLKFYVFGERIFETPTIVTISGQSIQEGKIISTLDGKIELLIKDIPAHRKITYLNRFILMGIAWDIEAYTRETTGLIHIFAKKGYVLAEDDMSSEIAYNETYNMDIPEEPPVILTPYSIIAAGETPSIDTINLEAQRTFKVIDNNTNLDPAEVFVFTLEKAIEINDIEPNALITLIDNIANTSCRLKANAKVKGYFYLVATRENIIIKKLIRIKGMMDK